MGFELVKCLVQETVVTYAVHTGSWCIASLGKSRNKELPTPWTLTTPKTVNLAII